MKIYVTPGLDIPPSKWEEAGQYTYIGFVARNANAPNLTQCAIARVDNTGGSIEWADGNQEFDNAWADRATLDYSQLTS